MAIVSLLPRAKLYLERNIVVLERRLASRREIHLRPCT